MGALLAAGEQAWVTGPGLRQLLTGVESSEARRFEVVTTCKAPRIRQVLSSVAELAGYTFESTPLRGLALLEPGRKGEFGVSVSSLREQVPPTRWFREQRFRGIELDLATREITLHAIAADLSGQIIDPFGGMRDLEDSVLRTVIPSARVFKEGGMWLLKVAKYISHYGYAPHRELLRAAQRDASSILDAPRQAWKPQLDKVLLGPFVSQALDFLAETTVLQFLIPEVYAMIGFHKTCEFHHKDLWDHTKQVIAKADRNLVVRWAALMHDIGKIWTRSTTRDGKVHFFRHEDLGALLFIGVAARLDFSPAETERVEYVIRQHSRVNLYDETWTDSAVRRLIKECGERLEDLVAFSRADFTTKRVARKEAIIRQLTELDRRISEIRAQDAVVPPLPKGVGNAIMERFALPPSKRVGELKAWLEGEVEAGRIAPHLESEDYVAYLLSHAEQHGLALPSNAEATAAS